MTRFHWLAAVGLTAALLIVTFVEYGRLPEQIPIHWDLSGQPDQFGPKSWAAFIGPAAMAAALALFALLPWLSPKRFEVDTFRSTYLFVMLLTVSLLGYLHVMTLWQALDGTVDLSRVLVGGLFVFFVLLGNVLGRVRRNFYIGVRTPWTLASERVWIDTHRLSAWLFAACGLVGLVLVLLPIPIYAVFIPIAVAALAPIVYSLVHYKRLERRGEL
jgi:uncharacterized membrane protein